MSNTVNNTLGTSNPASAGLTPDAVIEQIRTLRSQIGNVTPLSKAQRDQLNQRARKQPAPIVDMSIGVIGSSATVAQAVGQPIDDVLQLQAESVRWGHVADELRTFLKGVEGANLVRRERLAFIAGQAYSFGSQLARNPDNADHADLLPRVEEIKRLKSVARRKKAAQAPQTPSPVPPAPVPVTSASPKP